MEAKQFLVEFVQVISVGQPSTARENCPRGGLYHPNCLK